jgi:hypothetical protein
MRTATQLITYPDRTCSRCTGPGPWYVSQPRGSWCVFCRRRYNAQYYAALRGLLCAARRRRYLQQCDAKRARGAL